MQNYIGVLNFREQIRSILSPCGSFVFSGSEDRHGYVWNTDTGKKATISLTKTKVIMYVMKMNRRQKIV